MWCCYGFTDVDGIDDIIRLLPRGFGLVALHTNGQCGVKFCNLAGNILFRRCYRRGIGNNPANIVERSLPIVAQWNYTDESPVNRAADIVLPDTGLQITAPGSRPRFETAVDELQSQQINQYLLIVDDGILDLLPGSGNGHRNEARQSRFDDDLADF